LYSYSGASREHACVIEELAVPNLQRGALQALGFAGTRGAGDTSDAP